jgi:uncharacterized coiled-coil protein SlyX
MDAPTLAAWLPWVTVGQSLVTAAIAVALWYVRRDAARRAAIERIERTLDQRFQELRTALTLQERSIAGLPPLSAWAAHAQRIAILEERLGHLPSTEDLQRIHSRIDHVSEGMAELRGGIGRLQQSVDLLTARLLDHPAGHGHA